MRLRHDASCKYCLLERRRRFSFLGSAISFGSNNKQDTSLSQERGCVAFKSTTSCSPGDSFGTRETGDRRHVPPRLTRIGGPASIRARLCIRAESKLLQESRLAANTSSSSRPIVIDQKWRTGPISHVQFGVFVKLS